MLPLKKKFHLTPEQLRELIQFRTFARGLNDLRPGDDVDVPLVTVNDKLIISFADSSITYENKNAGTETKQAR